MRLWTSLLTLRVLNADGSLIGTHTTKVMKAMKTIMTPTFGHSGFLNIKSGNKETKNEIWGSQSLNSRSSLHPGYVGIDGKTKSSFPTCRLPQLLHSGYGTICWSSFFGTLNNNFSSSIFLVMAGGTKSVNLQWQKTSRILTALVLLFLTLLSVVGKSEI